ncbi:ABC transporter substrate-binding protein [Pseudonocardia adelaidensis]|uniref:Extracellular solute-binding protein n=1 Tax=Pseudonocardia adelaidensis TaxID=648754 RepID=A0ABP9NJA8_9PSEU
MRCRALVGLLLAGLLTACAAPALSMEPTDRVEVLSWWTSESEHAALTTWIDAYRAAHPDVAVIDAGVAGGSGSNAQVVLAGRLQSGDPPDVWQTFLGSSLRQYAEQHRIADVSAAYRPEDVAALPPAVVDALTADGALRGVATGAHRSNMLWFNTGVLQQAGVAPPGAGYTERQFLADLARLKAAGTAPLCLGGQDRFTSAELLEDVLLARVGSEGWAAIAADRFDWRGPDARAALGVFGTLLDHTQPAAATTTWSRAVATLAEGGCGFFAMNDSAYGELRAVGADLGAGIGGVAYPGTDGDFIAVIDTFVVAAGSPNGRNAIDLLATIQQNPDALLGFSAHKGSVPLRTDLDLSGLSPYQQQAAQVLRSGTLLMSVVHGEVMSPAFQQGFYDAVADFTVHRDPRAFADTLQFAVSRDLAPQR